MFNFITQASRPTDFKQSCRICLKNYKRLPYYSVFTRTLPDSDVRLCDAIHQITSVKLCLNDGLPIRICASCESRVIDAFVLKLETERNTEKLLQYLNDDAMGMYEEMEEEEEEQDEQIEEVIEVVPVAMEKKYSPPPKRRFGASTTIVNKPMYTSCVGSSKEEKPTTTSSSSLNANQLNEIQQSVVDSGNVSKIQKITYKTLNYNYTMARTDDSAASVELATNMRMIANRKPLKFGKKIMNKPANNVNIAETSKTYVDDVGEMNDQPEYVQIDEIEMPKLKREPLCPYPVALTTATTTTTTTTETIIDEYKIPVDDGGESTRDDPNEETIIELEISTEDVKSDDTHEMDELKTIACVVGEKKTYAARKHECSVCHKKFVGKSNLIEHLRLHANIKPYKCDYCGKSFTQSGNYTCHLRIHTKERPYKCNVCTKTYNQSSALKVHMRSHTNERNYECGECGKAFTNTSDLKKHQRIHNPEQMFKCDVCNHAFNQKSNMLKHIRAKHAKVPKRKMGATPAAKGDKVVRGQTLTIIGD